MKDPIYLDNAATTAMDPRVASFMQQFLGNEGVFGNPASIDHPYGWQARHEIDLAREKMAQCLNTDPRGVLWTSGATEANNLALQGAARFYQKQGRHIITMQTEHPSVIDCCRHLEKQGVEVTYLKPQTNGLLALDDLKNALRKETILVSIMCANNETGVIQPVAEIADIVKNHGALFHVDAVQAFGKLPIDLEVLPIDLLSVTAHKLYGPKGVGALFVRQKPKVQLEPLFFGGGQERGLRSGTLATHQIASFAEAARLACESMDEEMTRITHLRDHLAQQLAILPNTFINGLDAPRVGGILNICFKKLDSELLIKALPQIAIARGSACSSAVIEPSHVLLAYGLSNEEAHSSIRISLGRFTTQENIDTTVALFLEKVPLMHPAGK